MLVQTPLIWTAQLIGPDTTIDREDVTVYVRVTYNTLEAICLDAFETTESRATRPN